MLTVVFEQWGFGVLGFWGFGAGRGRRGADCRRACQCAQRSFGSFAVTPVAAFGSQS